MSKKTKKYIWVTGMLCAWPLIAPAQSTEPLTGTRRLFDDGKELFLRHDYAAAQQQLERYMQHRPQATLAEEAAYMLACSAFELKSPHSVEILDAYLNTYPHSAYANRVQALLASAYFFRHQYREAVAFFKGCDFERLADDDRTASTLRLGVSYLELGQLETAGVWFRLLRETSPAHEMDALYHLAYIDYVQKRYDKALQGFRQTLSDKRFATRAPYYIADINLIKGQYQEADHLAAAYLEAYPYEEKAVQMKRVRGEAAFGMQRYPDAVRWLTQYCELPGLKQVSRTALYKLGMAYFNTQVYSKAAQALGESAVARDVMAQYAYLHMGLSYLQLKDRARARMAFAQASDMDFDRRVQEQALYNYALCIHETAYSPFDESVKVFERFLNTFPNSEYADRVNAYLVEVYLNTRSYEAALQSIDKIQHPGERILRARQKLLFRLGTQYMAQADFAKAADYFTQSLALQQYDVQTKADACYWRGEAFYRQEQFAQAAVDFRHYLEYTTDRSGEEYGLALYALAYTHFKQKHYPEAQPFFLRCLNEGRNLPASVRADAYNRLGDCLFYQRNFPEAYRLYNQAEKTDASLGDYSVFQEAFVQGLQRNYAAKIETLNRLLKAYPASAYLDDALYEQGRAFVQLDDSRNAINRYSLLLQTFPESPLSRKAAGEIALLYYQREQYPEAIAAYKKVIETYPGSEEARLAQRDLKSIYIDLNRVDEYIAYVAAIPGGDRLDVNERDSLTYVAAERIFMRGQVDQAEPALRGYLQSFPNGAFSLQAHYYLGLIAFNRHQDTEAAAHLDRVIAASEGKFSTQALELGAQLAERNHHYAKADTLYRKMARRADTPEERTAALQKALQAASQSEHPTAVIEAATALLSQPKLAPEVEAQARFYRATACHAEGRTDAEMADLEVLSHDTRNVYGAQAKYLLAQRYFDQGKIGKAEAEVLNYIEVSTPHTYWLARSFVLLSDIYTSMGRTLDARQYLLSLRQNYHEKDDIAEMIETRLKKLNKDK